MAFLEWLSNLRTPWLDKFMLAITYLGSEIAFLVIALIIFWCTDKRKGYYILSVGFVGTILNQFMKLWFRVPRPWILKPGFTPVEGAVSDAGGYSFPSGHTQTAVGFVDGVDHIPDTGGLTLDGARIVHDNAAVISGDGVAGEIRILIGEGVGSFHHHHLFAVGFMDIGQHIGQIFQCAVPEGIIRGSEYITIDLVIIQLAGIGGIAAGVLRVCKMERHQRIGINFPHGS